MQPREILTDALTPGALGLTPSAFDTLLTRVLSDAEGRTDDETAQTYYALAYLHDLEAKFWRRQITSGSGDEGSFSMSEISARMAAAAADRDDAQAKFDALTGTAKPKRPRGSGSVPMVVEP